MADRTTPTIAAERDGGSGERPASRPGLSETPTVRTAEPVAEAEIREFPFEVDEGSGEPPAEPIPIVEDEAAEIPRRDEQRVEDDAPGDQPDAVVDLTDERPVQAETPAEVGPLEGGARPPEQDDEPSAAAPAPDVPTADAAPRPQAPEPSPREEAADVDPIALDDEVLTADTRRGDAANAEADTDTMDITDAVVQEEVEVDLAPERPDGFNDDPGVGGGMATEHHQDLLPTDEEPQPSDDEDEGPGGGPSTAADISPGIDLGMAHGSDDESTDDPFDIAPDLDGRTETGNLSEHEQGILDDLGDDPFENPLDDPVATGEEVPGEYDLSGNETGDGPSEGMTNANPVKGYKWDPIDGYVKLKEGEVDPDRTTMGEERVEAAARRGGEGRAGCRGGLLRGRRLVGLGRQLVQG